jgi:hypothetical protein
MKNSRQIVIAPLVHSSHTPGCFAVFPICRHPAGLVPVDDCNDAGRLIFLGRDHDVAAVEIAVREHDGYVVGKVCTHWVGIVVRTTNQDRGKTDEPVVKGLHVREGTRWGCEAVGEYDVEYRLTINAACDVLFSIIA